MRDIKFRAWAKYSKVMFWPDEDWYFRFGELVLPENTIVMQYTGLKDKNGKEIYEGDIVRYHYEYKSQRRSAEVVFDLGMFAVLDRNELERERNEGGHYMKLSSLNRVAVIGNIYENSELLTNSNERTAPKLNSN